MNKVKNKRILKAKFVSLCLSLLLLLSACEKPLQSKPSFTLPRLTEAESFSQMTEATKEGGEVNAAIGQAIKVEVYKTSDGDTIRAKIDGVKERIRLIGIDCPELAHPDQNIKEEYYGAEAAAFTRNQLEGQYVYLTFDQEKRDQYGRLLAYVWLKDPAGQEFDEDFVRRNQFNCILLEKAYAAFVRIPPNLRYEKWQHSLALQAKKAGLGMWEPH